MPHDDSKSKKVPNKPRARDPMKNPDALKVEILDYLEVALAIYPRAPLETLRAWFDRVAPNHVNAPEYPLAVALGMAEGANIDILSDEFEAVLCHPGAERGAAPSPGTLRHLAAANTVHGDGQAGPHDRVVLILDGHHPVDDQGFDDFHYWLGVVREMALNVEHGGTDNWLDQIKAHIANGNEVIASIEGDSGHYSVVVWSSDGERADIIWGAPCFRAPQDAEVILEELQSVVQELKTLDSRASADSNAIAPEHAPTRAQRGPV